MAAVEQSGARLERARRDHAEHEQRLVALSELAGRASLAGLALRRAEAAEAAQAATRASTRAQEIEALAADPALDVDRAPAADRAGGESGSEARLPGDRTDGVAARAAAALLAWDRLHGRAGTPADPPGTGTPADPPGTRTPADPPGTGTPADPPGTAAREERQPGLDVLAPGVDDQELHQLAAQLEERAEPADPTLVARLTREEARLGAARRRRRLGLTLLVAAGVGLLVGALLVVIGSIAAGLAVLAAGAGAVVAGFASAGGPWGGLRARGSVLQHSTVDALRVEVAAAERSAAWAGQRRAAAATRCAQAGLPADPVALRELVRRRAVDAGYRDRDEQWRRDAEASVTRELLVAAGSVGAQVTTADEAEAALRRWQREDRDAADELQVRARPRCPARDPAGGRDGGRRAGAGGRAARARRAAAARAS